MSDPTLDLPIRSTFDSRGADAALAALRQLQQAGAAQTRGGGNQNTVAATQAAVAQQRLATETQRTAVASNQAAVAAQRLSTEEQRTATATAQAAAAQTRAETAALRLAKAQDQVANASQKSAGFAKQMGDAFQSSLMGIIGPAAIATTAIAAVGKAGELIQVGAQAQQTEARFDQLAIQAHTTGDAMTAALRQASAGTISDTNLQLDAMKASMLGVAQNAEQLAPLLAIARDRAQQMGISTEFAFDSLVTGLGRGSRLILDNIGVMVKEGEVNEAYARSVGKTVAELTDQEKKQALVNEVLRQGQATMAATGGAIETNTTKLERMSVSIENAKTALGGLLAVKVTPLADDITKLVNAATGIGSIGGALSGAGDAAARLNPLVTNLDLVRGAADGAIHKLNEFAGTKIPDVLAPIRGSLASWGPLISALQEGKGVTEALSAAGEASAAAMEVQASAADRAAQSTMAQGDAANAAAAAMHDHAAAVEQAAQAAAIAAAHHATLAPTIQQVEAAAAEDAAMMQQVGVQTNTATIAAQQQTMALAVHAQQTIQSAIETERLSQFQAMLASMGGPVAAGLMSAANAAAVLASQYNITAGEALRLIQLQAQLANAQAASALGIDKYSDSVQRMITGGRSAASVQESQKQADVVIQNVKRVNEAKRQQVLATGTANEQIKQRESDLAAAERQYGRNSAEYINAETALQQERAQRARGAGRAAGAAKLSDQAKLNNQLLANEERFESQMEDAAQAHGKKLLDIEKDYQEKSLAQQRENEVAKRASRADFYENLTGATKDLGAQAAQQISAEYEAAYQKSQEIAQSGNQKLADDYLKMKQRQLNDEIEYQKRVAEAKKNKDKDEVAQLQQVHKLRQDANAEEEKQLMEGGDANQKARQEAIDAENEQYKQQTDHIIDQAARAGDAKESAAQRSGKAVSAENALLDQQLDKLRQIRDAAGQIPTPGGGGEDASGGDTGDSAAAGGGTFVTRGPTTLTVGDNPGGAELVQVTPLSGRGRTRVGSGMAQMAGGGALVAGGGGAMATTSSGEGDELATLAHVVAFLSGILPLIKQHNHLLKEVRTYQHTMEETIKVFSQIAALHKSLAQPLPPLPPGIFEQLADELNAAVHAVAERVDPNIHRIRRALEHMLAAEKTAVEIYQQVIALRQALVVPTKPISLTLLHALAAEAVQIVQIIRDEIIVANQKQTDELKRYSDLVQASVAALKDIAELHKDLEGAIPSLDIRKVEALAAESTRLVQILQQQVIPYSEQDAELLKRYQETTGASVDIIKGIADLANSLKDPIPAISPALMRRLADIAKMALQIVQARVIPQSQEQTDALKRYQESQGATVAILKDTADLGKALAEPSPAISAATVTRLADEAKRITQIVLTRMVPASVEQEEAAKRYAETTGAAISALKDTLDLPAKLFTDYQSPSNAQIDRVAADANRIVRRVNQAASVYSTDGLEAAKAFGDATSSVLGAFKEQLLFAQALGSGDFQVNPAKLALFEQGMARTLAVARRLGAQAAAIPAGNIAALQGAAEALTASYDSLIKLASVPFGNLPAMTGGQGIVGGNSTSITFNNTFVLPAGTTQQMGQQILGQLQQQLRMRQ